MIFNEVRQRTLGVCDRGCTLAACDRGWGPAANTEDGWLTLRSGEEEKDKEKDKEDKEKDSSDKI